ncbi:MAG: 1-deoxy-D-xylulose-5-phosphate synthase [Oscillospiraceae bacterium]|nr:1-deoxy-D-xylulose-5-phosphate synthase [Oscillospiraceae bacterium]
MDYSFLKKINSSDDVTKLSEKDLGQLCSEVRRFLIEKVSKTGGHLSANLGTVEIITAMHYCFSTPVDQFVFDVGHQCYTHKLYTGRREMFDGLRKLDGLSGFPSPTESENDAFISGHGSTSISLAVGLAYAKKIKHEPGYVIAVIGDGAFTGGMAYEGLNNIDVSLDNLIIILNDNKMSISKNVGSVPGYLSKLRTSSGYLDAKENVVNALAKIPFIGGILHSVLVVSKTFIRRTLYNSGTFFEELGLTYHQITDGNDVYAVCSALNAAKRVNGPVFIHAITTKGKGFAPAEENPGEYHGVSAFDLNNVPDPDAAPKDSYSTVFGKNLSEIANKNTSLCAVTAAMKYGTGLQFFYREHKARFFDVGMAEEHAVTFSGALAKSGLQPVVCLYSTFMQRAMDQYIHDVMLLNLNVMFGIDRAGLVPGDGETHQGIHDIGIFANYENTVIVCPSNYEELVYWQEYLINNVTGPKVLRYARGAQDENTKNYRCTGSDFDLITSEKTNKKHLIICYGRHFTQCMDAVAELEKHGVFADILKLNKVNPLPDTAVESAMEYENIHFYEEHVKNGGVAERFGLKLLEKEFDGVYRCHCVPNYSIKQATVKQLWEICGLDSSTIVKDIKGEK